MVDALASEYGWSVDRVLSIPCDQAAQLFHAMLYRKGVKTYRSAVQADDQADTLTDRLASIFQVDKE